MEPRDARLLVVDDNESNRDIMARQLRRQGYDVVAAGKYRLVEKIGSGTFGAVYKAVHQDLDHQIAIKILQPGVTATDVALKRFRQEGVAACPQ